MTPSPDSLLQQAIERHQRGDWAAAIDGYGRVLESAPTHAQCLYLLGAACYQSGRLQEAVEALNRFQTLMPAHDEGQNLLGNALQDLGRLDEAAQAYERAIRSNPKNERAHNNLGTLHRQKRNPQKAIQAFECAVRLKSDYAEALNNLGNAHQDLHHTAEALAFYEKAVQANPAYAQAYMNKGLMLQKAARLDEALASYEAALKVDPGFHQARWLYWLSLPPNYRDESEIPVWRARYERGLEELHKNVEATPPALLYRHYEGMGLISPFYLGYQAQNDLALQSRFGDLCASVTQKLLPQFLRPLTRPARARRRVGFLSAHIYDHTVAKLFFGWVKNLDRTRFETYVYHVGEKDSEAVTARWSRACDHYQRLAGVAQQTAQTILHDELDALIYLDIGMYPKVNQLASLRLAPVQCVAWGHPVTSGLSTMDYFLSSDLMEPDEDAQACYRERLIRLPNLSVCYEKPQVPGPCRNRADFGLKEDAIIYLCPQMLSKYLPRHDGIFAQIALEVPRAQFVFIEDTAEKTTGIMKQRLKAAFASQGLKAADHVRFLPYMTQEDYNSLNQISDIALDSLLWSGGNTTFEAIACGLPVITAAGPFMRSRHTAAILTQMGLPDLIADTEDEYVRVSVKMGQDPAFVSQMREKIRMQADRVFGDLKAVAALGDFLEGAL